MRLNDSTFPRDRGFTIIEVVIAMVLLIAIVSGVAIAAASGSRLEAQRDIKSRMVVASERVYEHLKADKGWVGSCRRSSATAAPRSCTLNGDVDANLLRDDVFDLNFTLRATALGIDNAGDGLARADTDGNVDDFFLVTLELGVPNAARARAGNLKTQTVSSIINGSSNSDSGALVVQFCGADNQVDERIQISACPQSPTWFELPDCLERRNCAPRSIFPRATPGSTSAASRFVAMLPVRPAGTFRLRKVTGDHAGTTVDSSAAIYDGSTHTYRFTDLPTGTWEITGYSVGGWVDWDTHHIPSTKQATVERQHTANALVALRRPGASGSFKFNFERNVRERWLGLNTAVFETPWIPECEQPASFNRDAFLASTVKCATPHMTISSTGSGTATSNMEGLNRTVSVYESDGRYKEIVTVRYIAEQRRASYVWQGAAGPGSFSTEPEPSGRYTERSQSGNSAASYSIPKARWTGSVRTAPHYPSPLANSTAAGTGSTTINQVPYGLNAGMTNSASGTINNVSTTWASAGGGACDPRYLWVTTSGSFGGGGCGQVRMRGDNGECYTNMSGGFTGVNYSRHDGCNGIYWPPIGGTDTHPGNFIVQICTSRISEVNNRRTDDVTGFTPALNDTDPIAWGERLAAFGYAISQTGSITLQDVTIDGPYARKTENLGNTSKTIDTGCRSSPSASAPLVCPALDRWDNCSSAFVLQIPATDGWPSAGTITDGNRPANSGGGMSALSG